MNTLSLFLVDSFPCGISYEDAVCLCQAIYSVSGLLPDSVSVEDLDKDGIAMAFAELALAGQISDYASWKGTSLGSGFHALTDKGHWIEVIAYLFKNKGVTIDYDRAKLRLSGKGTKTSCKK